MEMSKALANKVAIVTGASSGIGAATAIELARMGAAVVVHARRKERLQELAASCIAGGGQMRAVAGDASSATDNARLIDEAAAFSREIGQGGRIDIVVANAGRGLAGGLLSSDQAAWEGLYKLNVLGPADLMRRAGERMAEQKSGDIVALGSVSGYNISPFSGFYGSTKFAIASIAEAFRREVGAKGVRVTTIMPAVVISEFQENAGYTKENFYKTIEKFGKPLAPEDVARAIGFVVSQPAHVHINQLMIRPTGQDYP
ncbi:MAG TPA: SDR family oxidoreductase [Phycisphaerae bacterium]|nr:SDR family oxidoreductase [Phycisphaerae bacterium]